MGAFNWIGFQDVCPACGERSELLAQCHIFSSYDGDDSGLFHNRTYRVGQRMAWWNENDRRYREGQERCNRDREDPTIVLECCYSECTKCKADLFAVVAFRDRTVDTTREVGMEKDWPAGFLR